MARKWSQEVTESSNALDLEERVFTKDDPAEIARSLKRSAERSKRRNLGTFDTRDAAQKHEREVQYFKRH